MKQISLILLSLIALSITAQSDKQKVTVESLLKEMINRDNLARIDSHNFKTDQSSSYSRKSVNSKENGWFDNSDASQFIRTEVNKGRKEYVLLDEEGPGAIVRFWSTWHAQKFSMGTLRFYFDNSDTPQVEGRIDQIISSNKYIGKPLSQTASPFLENDGWFSGHNLYFPFPYSKHCKITYQKSDETIDDVLYYQINFRKYSHTTNVETYKQGDLESGKYSELTEEVARKLNSYDISGKYNTTKLSGEIKPDKYLSTLIKQGNAIKKIKIKIEASNVEQALRSTVLSIDFDRINTVWVPLGDFFGTGYKISPYKSWMSYVEKDGTMCTLFPMPFKKSAKITIRNYGNQDVNIKSMKISTSEWKWDDNTLYFHANWKNFHDIKTKDKKDINFITIKGKGKYAADALTLHNGSNVWWGEGDEKIYVDNEDFPSHFGTGTEDYYGYAWCSVVAFSAPFNAQPIGDGNRVPGLTVNNRWRSLDVIPFNKSLKFDMELWHWASTTMDYTPTTYWYGTYNSESNTTKDIDGVKKSVKLNDKFEGESCTVKKIKGGDVITEAFLSKKWSAMSHLLWKNIKKGNKLELSIYSPTQKEGELNIAFTNGKDYACADIYLNNKLLFKNLDFHNDNIHPKTYIVKSCNIKKGDNRLKFIVKESNKSNKPNKIGFDFIQILPNTKLKQK